MCAFLRCLGRSLRVLEQRSCHWHVACGTLGAMRGVMLILVSVLVAFSAQSAFADDVREHGRAPRGPVTNSEAALGWLAMRLVRRRR